MLRKQLIAVILSLCFGLSAWAGTIVLEGQYQQKNIYVQNGISGLGVGFCTVQVSVNGSVSIDEINSSSFEIDLAQYNFNMGAPLVITIEYKDDGCSPKVLNPNAIQPDPTFECLSIYVDRDGTLEWIATNEGGVLPYVIEQYKWKKWVKIGEMDCASESDKNEYSFKTTPIAGSNKFRVKQKGYMGKTKYSPTCSYTSLRSEVSFIYIKQSQEVQLSDYTDYEVYDVYGNVVKKGHGKTFDVSNLKKGATFYMNYGNTMGEFRKR